MALNPMDLTGRTIMVTGASSGLGKATAVLISRLGGRVILVARDKARLEETATSLEGTQHVIEPFDLRHLNRVPNWMKDMRLRLGPLHGIVHSAGIHRIMPLRAMETAQFEDIMQMNISTAFALAKGIRQKDVHAQSCSVVFISSVMGLVGQPGVVAYCASKGGLIAMTRACALELARDGIRVNCVAPGQIKTAMTEKTANLISAEQMAAIESLHPLGLGLPEDVANAVVFLLSETGRWITGSTLVVDGGYTAQ